PAAHPPPPPPFPAGVPAPPAFPESYAVLPPLSPLSPPKPVQPARTTASITTTAKTRTFGVDFRSPDLMRSSRLLRSVIRFRFGVFDFRVSSLFGRRFVRSTRAIRFD